MLRRIGIGSDSPKTQEIPRRGSSDSVLEPIDPLEGAALLNVAPRVVSRWWNRAFLPWGRSPMQLVSEVELEWSLSLQEVAAGALVVVVALAFVRYRLVSLELLVLAVLLLGAPVYAILREPRARRAQAARHEGGSKSRPTDAGPHAAGAADSNREQPRQPAESSEVPPPPEKWRVVSVYGVNIRVAEDGSGAMELQLPTEGELACPAPLDDKETSSTEAPMEPPECDDTLPRSFVTSSIRMEQCVHEATGRPEIRVTYFGTLGPEELEEAINFVDRFTLQKEVAEQGFAAVFDLRQAPLARSWSCFQRMINFSEDASKLYRWEALNFSKRIVVPSGPSWYIAKGLAAAWLMIRPPMTRILLLTDPDQPEEEGIVWEPVLEDDESPAPEEDERGPVAKEPEEVAAPLESTQVNEQLGRYLAFISTPS